MIMPYLKLHDFILFAALHGPFDDLILDTYMQFGEECAETGYPDHEVAVIFRMFLCIPEDLGVQHIELNVIAAIIEQRLNQAQYIFPAFTGIELIRREFHVHVRCAIRDGINPFCCRHHERGGSVDIGARHGRDTSVGECHSGLLAVWQRPGHHTKGVVATLGIGIE